MMQVIDIPQIVLTVETGSTWLAHNVKRLAPKGGSLPYAQKPAYSMETATAAV
jgi:hypothetical protein